MPERLLLHGGYVLSMNESIGELTADVLVEDGVIAAIGPELDAGAADRVDVTGSVVMPGFVDTHRHTWQTPFRGICAAPQRVGGAC
jgi:cytosine/adenosine deaminase-related metal-dependent hydrolase